MIAKWHKYFHWIYHRPGYNHYYNFGSGLFIWFFLSAAMPFGIYAHNYPSYFNLVLHLGMFAFIWTLISYAFDFLAKWSIPSSPKENLRADLKLWAVKVVALVQAYYLFRGYLCDWLCIDLNEYLELWLACFLMFLLTYIPFTLYGKYKYFQALARSGGEETTLLELKGSGKESLRIDLSKVLYLQSDDNYVDIFLWNSEDEKLPEKQTIRATLRSLENQLLNHPQFWRVHRSFIVNLQYVREVSSKKELLLAFRSWTLEVPVSKKYSEQVFQHLTETTIHHKND